MKRLLFLGGAEGSEVLELLRRESPALGYCPSLAELAKAVKDERPRLVVSNLASLEEVQKTLQALGEVPLVVVCEKAITGPERQAILDSLGERGTLLSPLDSTSLRATLRSWLQPLPDPALLDSTALARVYARGGRVLADRLVENFLSVAPILVTKAKAAFQGGDPQSCINCLESLGQQAGSLGAMEVSEAVEEILDELIEGGHVGDDQWDTLIRALGSTARFLGEQKRQDRTA